MPIKAIRAALQDAGIAAEISQAAGTFVCNHVFYGLMHALRTRPAIRGGFIHVPYPVESAVGAGKASALSLAQLSEALRIAARTALLTRQDLRIAAGTEY